MVKEDVVKEFDYGARAKLAKPFYSEVLKNKSFSGLVEEKGPVKKILISKDELKDIVKKFERKVKIFYKFLLKI
jgi:hypothetical protein